MSRKFIQLTFSILLLGGLMLGFAIKDGVLASSPQADPNAKIEGLLLDKFAADGNADFIVSFTEKADLSAAYAMDWDARGHYVYDTLTATAQRVQGQAKAAMEGLGLRTQTFISGNELYVWAGNLDAANTVAALPEVSGVRATRVFHLDPSMPSTNVLQSATWAGDLLAKNAETVVHAPNSLAWGIVDTKADQFWGAFGVQGSGILVANIDTGVDYTHDALDQNYKCAGNPSDPACWEDPTSDCPGPEPCDAWPGVYHGTHTMGTMVGDDDPNLLYQVGMAPDAQWIACLGCPYGGCPDINLNTCSDWLLAPGGNPDNRPDVVNNSWGDGPGNPFYMTQVQSWVAAGIFPAFSAGNGYSCNALGSPGDYQESFGSAAHQSSRLIADFSSKGPSTYGHDPYTKPNISAPGQDVMSAMPGDGWQLMSGTSMASPHTAGAVALLWSCNPGLVRQIDQTFQILQDNADTPPDGSCGAPPDGQGNYTYGYGYLDILNAGFLYCGDTGNIDGYVYDDVTTAPIVDATVHAIGEAGGGPTTYTDATGYYTMTAVAGTYTVTAVATGYEMGTAPGIVVVADETVRQDFYLVPKGTLLGYVTDFDNGFPLVGATVTADDGTIATTNDAGYYEMFLDEGTHDVTASMENYAPETASVVIVSGQSTQQDFSLEAAVAMLPSPVHMTLDYGTVDTMGAQLLNRLPTDYTFEMRENFVDKAGDRSPIAPPANNNATPPSGDGVVEQPVALQSSPNLGSGCVVALTAGTSAIEQEQFHNTLTELGFTWFDVNNLQQAFDGGANVLIDHYAAYNLAPTDIGTWLGAGLGYIELGDWPQWFPDTWEGAAAGTPLDIQVVDSTHPLMDGLPDTWVGMGFWAYDWPGWNALGYVVDPTYPSVMAAGYYGSMRDRAVTYQELGDAKAVYIGVNTYGYYAGDNDKRLLQNAITWTGNCGSMDVPWFAEEPVSGTVPAESMLDITFTFSATQEAGIYQAGDYEALLTVSGDPSLDVPVIMTVNPLATWGQLDGTVTDLCTGDPLLEALVSIQDGNPITQTMTDEMGYYSAWLEQGTYNVSYSAEGHVSFDTSATIVAGQVLTKDVQLVPDRPCISVSPDGIEAWVLENTAIYDTGGLTISNDGAQPLDFEIREKNGGFSPGKNLNTVPPEPLAAVENPGSASFAGVTPGNSPAQGNEPDAWFSAAPLPNAGVVRYAHAQCIEDIDEFYVIGGVENGSIVAYNLLYNANDNTWTSLAPIPAASEGPTATCYEGKIYVVGGGVYGVTTPDMFIYDIANDQWSTGPDLPRVVWGGAMGGYEGKIYFVGGDPDFYGGGTSNVVNIYDIATNTWTGTGSSMPTPRSTPGYFQLGEFLYVVGGWGDAAPGANSTANERYDMSSNTWESGPSFTIGKGDFGLAATSVNLYAIAGDANGGSWFDANPSVWVYNWTQWPSGAWADLADPIPTGVTANNGGFATGAVTGGEIWTTGGIDISFTWRNYTVYRPSEPPWSPTPTDVPWVWETPISGTIAADSFMDVDVFFTAISDTVPLPIGTYTATLRIVNNDPVAGIQDVPVTMHIVPEYIAPDVSFTSNSPVNLGAPVVFTNTSIPGIPPADVYEWNFGDGTIEYHGLADVVTHTYATYGTFQVALTATNAAGTDTFTADVVVIGKQLYLPIVDK